MPEGGFAMKVLCVAIIGILGVLASACVTGDEITSYVIEPDGAVSFHIYRSNLASDQTGEAGKEDLDSYIQKLEEKQDDLFTKLAQANAKEVEVTVVRRISPASILITGQIPTLTDFVSYLEDGSECTPISGERVRGFHCEVSPEPSQGKDPSENAMPRADSFNETRFALAAGTFTEVEGFLPAKDKRSVILDIEALMRSQIPTSFSLEWQIPETP
jgi:hypothetical protein